MTPPRGALVLSSGCSCGCAGREQKVLARRDLPFGSSVVLAAVRPVTRLSRRRSAAGRPGSAGSGTPARRPATARPRRVVPPGRRGASRRRTCAGAPARWPASGRAKTSSFRRSLGRIPEDGWATVGVVGLVGGNADRLRGDVGPPLDQHSSFGVPRDPEVARGRAPRVRVGRDELVRGAVVLEPGRGLDPAGSDDHRWAAWVGAVVEAPEGRVGGHGRTHPHDHEQGQQQAARPAAMPTRRDAPVSSRKNRPTPSAPAASGSRNAITTPAVSSGPVGSRAVVMAATAKPVPRPPKPAATASGGTAIQRTGQPGQAHRPEDAHRARSR